MTPEELTTLCETIYGKTVWLSKLARDLVREPRTVRRWETGESPVPAKVQSWLRAKASRELP
ncbi:hypothetical protein [Zavarzinella formosa]|uniref:hypothetical protein n=1 Tax=Zavarzinella formosa TaxID=360055 RepID=UPI0002FC2251|nr:hypothetical protein [Zavarzinella formosa]